MLVYHGLTLVIQEPDILHSKKYVDFGPGFYVTTFPQQAEKWALRKAMRKNGTAFVNVYDMTENLTELKVLHFKEADGDWLDFVCACRSGADIYKDYDVIVGNVADDDVFKSVDMYYRNIWDRSRTLQELRYYKCNDQVAFISQQGIDKALKFIKAYEVAKND